MIPETSSVSQLSQVISQAAAPGFILAALAGFTSLLITRQNRIVDRTIVLDHILCITIPVKMAQGRSSSPPAARSHVEQSNPVSPDQQYRDSCSRRPGVYKRPPAHST